MEQLFKVFMELLTKKKNQLATDTMFNTALIKDSMKRKYPEDKKHGLARKQNMVVSVRQYMVRGSSRELYLVHPTPSTYLPLM